jgi:hypothetical protein
MACASAYAWVKNLSVLTVLVCKGTNEDKITLEMFGGKHLTKTTCVYRLI